MSLRRVSIFSVGLDFLDPDWGDFGVSHDFGKTSLFSKTFYIHEKIDPHRLGFRDFRIAVLVCLTVSREVLTGKVFAYQRKMRKLPKVFTGLFIGACHTFPADIPI